MLGSQGARSSSRVRFQSRHLTNSQSFVLEPRAAHSPPTAAVTHSGCHPALVSPPTAGPPWAAPRPLPVPGPLPALGFSGAPFATVIRQLSVLKDLDQTRWFELWVISKCQAENATLPVSTAKEKDESVSLWGKIEISSYTFCCPGILVLCECAYLTKFPVQILKLTEPSGDCPVLSFNSFHILQADHDKVTGHLLTVLFCDLESKTKPNQHNDNNTKHGEPVG